TISDLDEVWILINVYSGSISQIKKDMQVQIRSLSYPDDVFEGKIAALSQVFDEEERVLKARVIIPNPDFKLKPGMLVDVIAQNESATSALSIPTDALVFDDNQHYAVVYKNDCDMEIRRLQLISKNGST